MNKLYHVIQYTNCRYAFNSMVELGTKSRSFQDYSIIPKFLKQNK